MERYFVNVCVWLQFLFLPIYLLSCYKICSCSFSTKYFKKLIEHMTHPDDIILVLLKIWASVREMLFKVHSLLSWFFQWQLMQARFQVVLWWLIGQMSLDSLDLHLLLPCHHNTNCSLQVKELNLDNQALGVSWKQAQAFLVRVCGAYVENLLVSFLGALLCYVGQEKHIILKQKNVLQLMVIVKM